jgi:hypothetical protein
MPSPWTGHGDLALTYYQYVNRGNQGTALANVWFASSPDRGVTWSSSLLVGPFDVSAAPGHLIADYDDLQSTGRDEFKAVFEVPKPYAQNGPSDIFSADLTPSARRTSSSTATAAGTGGLSSRSVGGCAAAAQHDHLACPLLALVDHDRWTELAGCAKSSSKRGPPEGKATGGAGRMVKG